MRPFYTDSPKIHALDDLRRESIDFALIYCGKEHCEPSYCYGPNRRENFVLHIITEGKGVLETAGKSYPLKENQGFILFPDTEAYYRADSIAPWTYIWVGFDGVKAYDTMASAGFSAQSPVQSFPGALVEGLEEKINKMLQASNLSLSNELRRNSLLMELMADLVENNELKSGIPDREYPQNIYVKHAMDYITHHLGERIRIKELADYIGVNRSYLTTSFKAVLGISPQEFLVGLRMDRASSLLRNTAEPIGIIAEQVGYDDPMAFSRIFKKYTGMPPKHFRDLGKGG